MSLVGDIRQEAPVSDERLIFAIREWISVSLCILGGCPESIDERHLDCRTWVATSRVPIDTYPALLTRNLLRSHMYLRLLCFTSLSPLDVQPVRLHGERAVSLARPGTCAYSLYPEKTVPRPTAPGRKTGGLGRAVSPQQPLQLKRKKKPWINRKNIFFKGSLGEFHRAVEPSPKNKMDLVGWHPSGGLGYGHMTFRRRWGKKDSVSGEYPYQDIRAAKLKQFEKMTTGDASQGFQQLQIGNFPSESAHRARMAGRPKPARAPGARYDQTTSTRVNLSLLERRVMDRHLARADSYHLWGEGRQKRCTAARCMSPAELLLEMRGQPKPEGLYNPHDLVGHVAKLNSKTTGKLKKTPVSYAGPHEFWKNAMVGTDEKPRSLPKEWEEEG